jgi:uncharacterized protein (DUF1330 family)
MVGGRSYLEVSDAQGATFFGSPGTGPVVMLNLLRFRDVADYSHAPGLAPEGATSGREAYARYMREMQPLLEASGGAVLFSGSASGFLIGPADETWDHVLLVRQASKASFLAFASDPAAQAITVHRSAAISDSRLLPLNEV